MIVIIRNNNKIKTKVKNKAKNKIYKNRNLNNKNWVEIRKKNW